ncbi:Protein PET100 like, mitochondrial [Pseudolycoriella hygida]|uniref:Protein PET100 like, mitochondrial n=1 Tax=Pseudolycoriella hygida TaxID=35572 RepID=A0A9Q0MS88_9DIPT|nr:Protein PET100 like, mitochondrial [Pseudolycoriella hygida]
MGNWQLEVAKMAIYISFPVAMFHYFNQPAYFEKWVTNTKREIYPPENEETENEIKNFIKEMRRKQDIEMMRVLDESRKSEM